MANINKSLFPAPLLNGGINVGSDSNFNGSDYNETVMKQDLTFLSQYFTKVRIALPNYNDTTGIANMLAACKFAKRLGFYVICGLAGGSITSTILAGAYTTAHTTQAPLFNAWVDEWQVGNELEGNHDGTIANSGIPASMNTLAGSVKSAGFTGKVSYSVPQDIESTWIGLGDASLGANLDYVGYNVYGSNGSPGNFRTKLNAWYAAFPTKGFISEWNTDSDWNDVKISDNDVALDIRAKAKFIANLKPAAPYGSYFFCWKFDGTSVLDFFAARKQSGAYRRMWQEVAGGRPVI